MHLLGTSFALLLLDMIWLRCCHLPCLAEVHKLLLLLPIAWLLQAYRFVPGSELITMEPAEAVEKLRLTLRVLGAFKTFYFEYRAKSATEVPENP